MSERDNGPEYPVLRLPIARGGAATRFASFVFGTQIRRSRLAPALTAERHAARAQESPGSNR